MAGEDLVDRSMKVISYDDAKRLAAAPDSQIRQDLAAREDIAPEVLYFLAEDEDLAVRKAVAVNHTAPVHASLILARDPDVSIRSAIAKKVSRLTPDFDPKSRERAERYVVQTLEALAQDQAVKIRKILAQSLCEVTNAPASVIRCLAEDVEDTVACLVLEGSPLLTDADLLEIISKSSASQRLKSVSRRPNLSADVSDAIAATHDIEAVAELLANGSAQIRENTLDALVCEAADRPSWHAPLVERPELSWVSIHRLASFVTTALLSKLEKHPALDRQSAKEIAAKIKARLGKEEAAIERSESDEAHEAQALFQRGELDSELLSECLIEGRRNFVIEGLSLLSGKPRDLIVKVLVSGSVKGVTAVCWAAGLSMRFATQVQFQMSSILPDRALYARSNGDYPLSEDEMKWQINFFENMDEPAIGTASEN